MFNLLNTYLECEDAADINFDVVLMAQEDLMCEMQLDYFLANSHQLLTFLTFRADGHSVSDGKVLHSARQCKSVSTSKKGHSQCKTGPIWVHSGLLQAEAFFSAVPLFTAKRPSHLQCFPFSIPFKTQVQEESEVGEIEQIGFNCILIVPPQRVVCALHSKSFYDNIYAYWSSPFFSETIWIFRNAVMKCTTKELRAKIHSQAINPMDTLCLEISFSSNTDFLHKAAFPQKCWVAPEMEVIPEHLYLFTVCHKLVGYLPHFWWNQLYH